MQHAQTTSRHNQRKKTILHELLSKLQWKVGADLFFINNNTLACSVDYYSKFPVMRSADGLSADDLIRAAKIMFVEFELPKILHLIQT